MRFRCPKIKKYISPPSHCNRSLAASKSNSPGLRTMSARCSSALESACFGSIDIICSRTSEEATTPKYAAASSTSFPSGRVAPSGTPSVKLLSPVFANCVLFLRLLLFSPIVGSEPCRKSLGIVVQTNPFLAIASGAYVLAVLLPFH